jgi:hypothetical protein
MHQMKNHFEREMRELEKEVKRQGKGSAEKNEVSLSKWNRLADITVERKRLFVIILC